MNDEISVEECISFSPKQIHKFIFLTDAIVLYFDGYQASRDGPTNKVRARMSIASSIIFGSVFWRMGNSQTSIQDRMGLLQVLNH